MRLTRKDVRATVVVVGAAVFYTLWLTGTVAADMSTRVVAAIVFALGWLGCTSDVDQMKVVFGVEGTRPPLLYVVLASLVGGVALVAGAVAIIWGNEVMLATLIVAMAALWIVATVRHQIAGRPVLHDDVHGEEPLGRVA